MFKRISYSIAWQFTAFVFLLLLINGMIFLAVDFQNAQRQSHDRISHSMQLLTKNWNSDIHVLTERLPPNIRDRLRIIDVDMKPVYSGMFFTDIPFTPREGISTVMMDDEQYNIMTATVRDKDGMTVGYVQMGDVDRLQLGDLPERALLYLLVCVAISALIFGVGLFFARRSLKPAEQMMERLEQFTQDASHELRTPLAALNSSLDLALKTGKHQEGIRSAKDDVKEITVLIERLLELARLDRFALKAESVDFSALVHQTSEQYTALAQMQNVTIRETIAKDITVRGDGTLLRQVIGNLLSNAIKFNNPNGSVQITLTKHALTIADTGIGIAKDDLPHLFDRFYQVETSRAKDGYGLGLALVRRITELHGWSTDMESVEGKGTTVMVKIKSE